MSDRGELRAGRLLAVATRVWLRRFLALHLVAGLCLAPLAIIPRHANPAEDGRILGLFGVYADAALLAVVPFFDAGVARNVAISYVAQFAVMVLVVRDVHARLSGTRPATPPRAVLGLLLLASASFATFVALDLPARSSPGWFIPATLIQLLLGAAFWVAIPAAAVEGLGFRPALIRSLRLVRGSGVMIAAVLCLVVVLDIAMMFVVALVLHEPWAFAGPAILGITLKGAIVAAAHHELRRLREGPSPHELGAIFA